MSNAANNPSDLAPLASALRADDLAAAERLAGESRPDAIRGLADSMMRCRRWRDAAWLLERVAGATLADLVKGRLSKNFAALQVHRPAVYELLAGLPDDERFGIAPSPAGPLTILARRDDGSAVSLAAAADPIAGAGQIVAQLTKQIVAGEAIALCGAGDGYVLSQLSAVRAQRFLGMEQALFLLEPEARVMLLCLMIHDLTGPAGPIEQERVRWFVGPTWSDDLVAAIDADPYVGLPGTSIAQGPRGGEARTALQSLTTQWLEADKRTAEDLAAHYAAVDPGDLSQVMQGRAGRRPRVMLLTTRFSTVLQYSTRDTARAFEQAGWDATVVIEPSPSHRLYQPAIRRVMNDFRPDLVFQIDHLRHEHGSLFPGQLPFACWIQDHLPNLKSEQAGRQVGAFDFVLTDAPSTYVRTFGYPRRQILPMSKLTVVQSRDGDAPTRDDEWENDICFVSNASATPDALFDAARREFAQSPAAVETILAVGRQMLDVYAAGRQVETYADIVALVSDQIVAERPIDADTLTRVLRWLCHPFNDALYRQQALRWAADAARANGWRLSLYGNGWERNEEFAEFARGPVSYGADLAGLTRRTKVNLQVVPYLCLHQRLLDGLAAGGFFLARAHVSDVAPQAMSNLLHSHFPESARTLAAARAVAPPPVRDRFESLVAACRNCLCSMGDEDPVEMVRDLEAGAMLVPGADLLPHFDEIRFASAAELTKRLNRFIGDPAARERVAAAQRESVAARLGYAAGVRGVGEFVARRLAESAASAATASIARPNMTIVAPAVAASAGGKAA